MTREVILDCLANSKEFRIQAAESLFLSLNSGSDSPLAEIASTVELFVRRAGSNKIQAIKDVREYSRGRVDYFAQIYPSFVSKLMHPTLMCDDIGNVQQHAIGLGEAKKLVESIIGRPNAY